MNFHYPHKTIEEQIDLLKERGLKISDEENAKRILTTVSYYRLKPFFAAYQPKNDDVFSTGSKLESILDDYYFDREFRILLFDAIERIEVALKTQISYHYSTEEPIFLEAGNHFSRYWWYEHSEYFKSRKLRDVFLQKVDSCRGTNVEKFKDKYFKPIRPPSWMIFENLTMGAISELFEFLKSNEIKNRICDFFGIGEQDVLESWLRSLTYLRNVCAHHNTLINRTFLKYPKYPKYKLENWLTNQRQYSNMQIFFSVSCCLYLLKRVNPTSNFAYKVNKLITKYNKVDMDKLGFHDGWNAEPVWKIISS